MDINNQIDVEKIFTKFIKNLIQQEIEFYENHYSIKFTSKEINEIKNSINPDKMIGNIYNLCYCVITNIYDEREKINKRRIK